MTFVPSSLLTLLVLGVSYETMMMLHPIAGKKWNIDWIR